MKILDKLPKLWLIEITKDNVAMLENWKRIPLAFGGYLDEEGRWYSSYPLLPNHTRIATEDFKAHILGILPEKWKVQAGGRYQDRMVDWANGNSTSKNHMCSHGFLCSKSPDDFYDYLSGWNLTGREDFIEIPVELWYTLVYIPWVKKEMDRLNDVNKNKVPEGYTRIGVPVGSYVVTPGTSYTEFECNGHHYKVINCDDSGKVLLCPMAAKPADKSWAEWLAELRNAPLMSTPTKKHWTDDLKREKYCVDYHVLPSKNGEYKVQKVDLADIQTKHTLNIFNAHKVACKMNLMVEMTKFAEDKSSFGGFKELFYGLKYNGAELKVHSSIDPEKWHSWIFGITFHNYSTACEALGIFGDRIKEVFQIK